MIPSSNVPTGFINGFNGSPILDEMGNSNFLVFFFSKFHFTIVIHIIAVFKCFPLFLEKHQSSKCADKNSFPLEFDKEDFDTIKNKPEILSGYEKVENLAD